MTLPTTIFDVYDGLAELGRAWPVDRTASGEEFVDNGAKQTRRWMLWIGNATDGGTETNLATDLAGGSSREESFSIEWAIVGKDGRSGMTPERLRDELRAYVERLQTLLVADHTLGGACTWCTLSVEFVDHGTTEAGSLARVGGAFEILSLIEP
ncbi:MAG: hypothetical protein AAGA99_27330 [Actinomycetota bacterium]